MKAPLEIYDSLTNLIENIQFFDSDCLNSSNSNDDEDSEVIPFRVLSIN